MSEIKLPKPSAWREDDGHWIYYDETNRPDTFEHIAKYQKDAHEKRVFALYTAEQVRQAVLAERERCARVAEDMVDPMDDGWDECIDQVAAAIRRG